MRGLLPSAAGLQRLKLRPSLWSRQRGICFGRLSSHSDQQQPSERRLAASGCPPSLNGKHESCGITAALTFRVSPSCLPQWVRVRDRTAGWALPHTNATARSPEPPHLDS
eukprot:366489-Chlamydomonas_euryale.AAC.6